MKPPVAPESSRVRYGPIRKHALRARHAPRRECIGLSDPTDCLLEAYDCVARRAYENFLMQGPRPGGELDDWLNAERELLLGFVINVENTENFVYAMASVPGATAERIVVGIESRWLVILAQPGPGVPFNCAKIHTDASRIPEAQPTSTANAEQRMELGGRREPASRPDQVADASRGMAPRADDGRGTAPRSEDDRPPAKSVCVLELPADVDAARSIAVICDGLIGIRMPKTISRA
jgi:hypothetical protein